MPDALRLVLPECRKDKVRTSNRQPLHWIGECSANASRLQTAAHELPERPLERGSLGQNCYV
jgi:hypothetical protein